MTKTTLLYSSISTTQPRPIGSSGRVMILSDGALTVFVNGRKEYQPVFFLELKNVERLEILAIGTAPPDGVVEIISLEQDEDFDGFRPFWEWGSFAHRTSALDTSLGSPLDNTITLPAQSKGILHGVYVLASAPAVAFTEIQVYSDNSAKPLGGKVQLGAQAFAWEIPMGIKVPVNHTIRHFFTPTALSTAVVIKNYRYE